MDNENKDIMDNSFAPDATEVHKDLDDDKEEGFAPAPPSSEVNPDLAASKEGSTDDGLKYSPIHSAGAEDAQEAKVDPRLSFDNIALSVDMDALDPEEALGIPAATGTPMADKPLPKIGIKSDSISNPGIAIKPFPKMDGGAVRPIETKADAAEVSDVSQKTEPLGAEPVAERSVDETDGSSSHEEDLETTSEEDKPVTPAVVPAIPAPAIHAPAPVQDKPVVPPSPVQDKPVAPPSPVQDKPVVPPSPVQDKPVVPPSPVQDKPVAPLAPVQDKPVVPPAPAQDKPVVPPAPAQDKPAVPPTPSIPVTPPVAASATPPTPGKRPPVPPPAGASVPPTAPGRLLREGEVAYTQEAINDMLAGGKNDEARDLGKVKFNDNNWYAQVFNEDFFRTIPRSIKRQTQREVKFIRERMGLQPRARVLDLCCGYGRHSIELSKSGYDMVGLDLSMTMLKKALKDAQDKGQAIKFIHGDMRKLAFKGIFDAIFCVDTSFGYFDELSNFKVIQGIFRALKPGGVFMIETVNRDFFIDELPMRLWWKGTECMLLEEIDMDYLAGVTYIQRSFVFDGNVRPPWEQRIQIRLYSVNEMRALLTRAGFEIVELSGDYTLPGAFFGAESPRLIFIAEKPIK